MTDFGADHSFAEVAKKLKEHYRIEVPISASRTITQLHAQNMLLKEEPTEQLSRKGVSQLIGEMDGTNIPIVEIPKKSESSGQDRRKLRKGCWREARLALARKPESVRGIYRATLGGADEAGEQLQSCVVASGGGIKTRLHCVGDAASWIINQVERRFSERASYLIDFYHLSEYLSAAAEEVATKDKQEWVREQQTKMKGNKVVEVIKELRKEIEKGKGKSQIGMLACERYMANHEEYFDYKGAIEKGLPIGSGEVEGGHRWVIQKRLKISGAWWGEEGAEKMLALRVVRANEEWESYWEEVGQAAA